MSKHHEHTPTPTSHTPHNILRLPDEITLMIIQEHYNDTDIEAGWGDYFFWPRSPIRSPEWMNVLGVCKLWRELGCSTSSFWRPIRIDGSVEWFTLRLARARQSPVDLHIPGDLDTEPPQWALDILSSRSPRIHSISFRYHAPEDSHLYENLWEAFHHELFSSSAAATSVFYTNIGPSLPDTFLLQSLETERLPRITTLFVGNLSPPTSGTLYSRLETLQLSDAWGDEEVDDTGPEVWKRTLVILSHCANLRKLVLQDCIWADPSLRPVTFEGPVTVLPRLESLTLCGKNSPFLYAALLSAVRLPALVELLMDENLDLLIEKHSYHNRHEYSFIDMIPKTHRHSLRDNFPAIHDLNAMSIHSTQLVHTLILRAQQRDELLPDTPPTEVFPTEAPPSTLVQLSLEACSDILDYGDEDHRTDAGHLARFHALQPHAVLSAATLVAGQPITSLTLDIAHSLGRDLCPWEDLFAALPALTALHVAGHGNCSDVLSELATNGRPFTAASVLRADGTLDEDAYRAAERGRERGPVVCPRLARLRIGGPRAVVFGEWTLDGLVHVLEWRAERGAARIEELEVGLAYDRGESAEGLAASQAECGARIAALVGRATFDHASAGLKHGRVGFQLWPRARRGDSNPWGVDWCEFEPVESEQASPTLAAQVEPEEEED
ncbi:uncharacterized protein BXZ73DRAFT_107115 [Epithele typhae]|uniref:uncharacterized protein n=1 Tax=Epithele typhae TaxID=378194 RepID=UPI00200820B2|nr:uncharacterized protein BXZ73DRAFT_107115 [Epithele typhae]KAH9912970.1 hypothetical protein BXZ73DRAFT_107115 [Epithele typhae]